MPAVMFKVKCMTNMHVGGGDINYSLIDNEVERDPITDYPVIHASGVKGALREYFSRDEELCRYVNDIFGRDEPKQTAPGRLKFLEANMLAVPARASAGDCVYYLVSTEKALENYAEFRAIFLGELHEKCISELQSVKERSAEGIPLNSKRVVLGEEIHILSDNEFKKIPLPVIARNKLENGISKNVWYEEVVPRKSVFYFWVISNNIPEDAVLLERFKNIINNQVIQFGANASIGYGLCMITAVEENKHG